MAGEHTIHTHLRHFGLASGARIMFCFFLFVPHVTCILKMKLLTEYWLAKMKIWVKV